MKNLTLSTLLLLLAIPCKIIAGTFYISTSGNDTNPGTWSLPWKTLKRALDSVAMNDTIFIMPGTYFERSVILLNGKQNIVVKGIGNVIINGYFPEFINPQQTQPWELWDASKGIYRSVQAYSTSANPLDRDQVGGTFLYQGEEHRFVQRRGNYFTKHSRDKSYLSNRDKYS